MPEGRKGSIAVLGGGLYASLTALALAHCRPDHRIYLVTDTTPLERDVISPVLRSSLNHSAQELLEPFIVSKWPGYFISRNGEPQFHEGEVLLLAKEQIQAEIAIQSPRLEVVHSSKKLEIQPNLVELPTGRALAVDHIIDLREELADPENGMAFNKVLQTDYVFDAPHGLPHPVMYLASPEAEASNEKYSQLIPFSETHLRVVTIARGQIKSDPNLPISELHRVSAVTVGRCFGELTSPPLWTARMPYLQPCESVDDWRILDAVWLALAIREGYRANP
ncbi:hypothetical protein FGU71_05105 [Erythrobacter insulae]|uniref:Uncharacterized protein n=1 Tax=Erythrobacter insulae TaxID=2584124 RepID=A0A547PAW3_9SPHN|nr:hypothetical protein [Erythrobacter insulae]TRD11286.1 hypothetical protein FGU71_05105 [Erythrobacter insulae]